MSILKTLPANLIAADGSRKTRPTHIFIITHGTTKFCWTDYDRPIVVTGAPGGTFGNPQTFDVVQSQWEPPSEENAYSSIAAKFSVVATDVKLRQYFVTSPTQPVSLQVYRVNSPKLPGALVYADDLYLDYTGSCSAVGFKGYVITGVFVQSFTQSNSTIPNRMYQKPCQIPVYGASCGLNIADYRNAVSLYAVSRVDRTVDVLGTTVTIGSTPRTVAITGETFNGGMLEDPGSINSIGIVAGELVTLLGGPGVRLWLNWWPGTLLAGSDVNIIPGCMKIVRFCNDFHQNLPNFRGFPYIPVTNPVTNGILTVNSI